MLFSRTWRSTSSRLVGASNIGGAPLELMVVSDVVIACDLLR
jgi:hypothetical protein